MEYTSKITTVFDKDALKLMDKKYPLYDDDGALIFSKTEAKHLFKILIKAKLNRYYDCIKKAKIVAEELDIKYIHFGSLKVESTEKGVMYGYSYNPPLELHAWLQLDSKINNTIIIDFALAGTIEKGLITKDDIGYFLIDREPIVLAGKCPSWLHYKTYEIMLTKDVNTLNDEETKNLFNKTIWRYQ